MRVSYPFSGKLIDGVESYKWLIDSIPNLQGEALICSAFLKSNVLEEFFKLCPKEIKVKVLSRWQLGDLIVGASDLSSYQLCKKFGWDFYVKLNFHGKVFWIPNSGILVGSANATSSGFGLKPNSNSEVGTIVDQNSENVSVIRDLFSQAIKINDETFNELQLIVESHEKNREKINWPRNILNTIDKTDYSTEKFFISECFQTNGFDIFNETNLKNELVVSDLSLLGILNRNIERPLLIELFISSKPYAWLYSCLQKNGGSMSFGAVTSALHDALVENPAPYRSEIKCLVQNIYSWIKLVGSDATSIQVSQPNHSEILKII